MQCPTYQAKLCGIILSIAYSSVHSNLCLYPLQLVRNYLMSIAGQICNGCPNDKSHLWRSSTTSCEDNSDCIVTQ